MNDYNGSPKLPVLIVMHGVDSSSGRVGQLLRRRGHVLDVRKPRFGDKLPESMAGHAGAVIFGGPMSANDPDDFICQEIEWISVPLREKKPFLGVCLGGQMLAKQLGAKVEAHPRGLVEIGYKPVLPTRLGAELGAWPQKFYQWHREGIEVPAGGELLATGDAFPNQAFRYGPNAIGLQFHPEITYALVNRWTNVAEEHLSKPGADVPDAQRRDHVLFARGVGDWLGRLLDRWLEPVGVSQK